MAGRLDYWDYDRNATITCDRCGWTGTGGQEEEPYDELLDVCCPKCGLMLLIVPFPTAEETRAAAAAGNPRAKAELPSVDAREARLERAARLELASADQLPAIEGDGVRIEWDFCEEDGESWTILRHDGNEIWRELAYYEGYERFADVFALLHERYGGRFRELHPSRSSWLYLFGDKLSAPDRVATLNGSLGNW